MPQCCLRSDWFGQTLTTRKLSCLHEEIEAPVAYHPQFPSRRLVLRRSRLQQL